MTATTPNYAIPYPEITDFVKDGATAMEAIAEKVDDILSTGAAARNILYNGQMQIAQRQTSIAGITGTSYYTVDRWETQVVSFGTWTQSVENDAPTGSGFRKSLKMLCTGANASPVAGAEMGLRQRLEGQELQMIRKGTSAAQQLTLSFWVKANKTGTYIAELFDGDNTRQVSKAYTVNASATWEYKTLTFPADTTGVLDNDNLTSLFAVFWLAAGTTFTSGTLNSTAWANNTNANRAVGQVNLADTVNNYWQITGIQLTTGPVATPFEFKTFNQELAECQRYYQKSYTQGVFPATATQNGSLTNFFNGSYGACSGFQFRRTMRAAPSITLYAPATGTTSRVDGIGVGDTTYTLGEIGDSGIRYIGMGAGTAGIVFHYVANAELS